MPSPGSQAKERGLGWTILVLTVIILSVAGFLIGHVIWKTKQVEQTLNDTMGEAPTFVPSSDGLIPPERMEAFLRVRERVFEHCSEFQGHFDELVRLDELEQDPEVSKSEALKEGFGGLKRLLRAGPGFLRFMEARNGALLEEEMGLGEYMYIYVLAYRDQLQLEAHSRFASFEQAFVGVRARGELAQILRNQLEALEAHGPERKGWAAELRNEVASMGAMEKPLPWEAGLPPGIAASLEPYAESLDALYCSGLAKMELAQKNKGLDIKN
jgi:hypothetical protein